jgi:Tfp pilus assembly protein PilF
MRVRSALLLLLLTSTVARAQNTPRGVQLFEAGEWAKARSELSAAVQRDDGDARAHFYIGRLDLQANDLDAATRHFEQAVKLADGVSDYHLWLGKTLAQRAMHASMMEQMSLGGRMKSECERSVALDAGNLEAREMLLDLYMMAPPMMGGGMDKAREQADAIAKRDAGRGHLAYGRMAAQAKDSTTAVRELNAAIAATPDTIRAYSALASWYAKQKEWPQAFAAIDRYVQRRPGDPAGAYAIGRIAALSGQQLERGEKGLRAYLAKPPRDATPPTLSMAYLRLGQVLDHEGRGPDARAAFEQALKLDPTNDDAKKALK